jgi:murein DD-endopeptidase MepM/ murein hydrolase activator NlpD
MAEPLPARAAPPRSRWAGVAVALLSLALSCHPTHAGAPAPALSLRVVPEQVRQGGVAVLRIGSAAPLQALRVLAGSEEIPVPAPAGSGSLGVLVGIDLEHLPGPLPIRVEAREGPGRSLSATAALRVVEAHFPVQRLTLPRSFVELDAATLARIQQEQAILSRLWETVTPDRLWQGPFRIPLESAAPPTGFGVRRIINGEPRAPHTGADFPAPADAPVLAANAGTVALVAEQFFSGRMVILDHGLGLYTMYFHLQENLVREGQRVALGEAIGRVGSTGRATGPHLHWGARLNGARIDPDALVTLSSLD